MVQRMHKRKKVNYATCSWIAWMNGLRITVPLAVKDNVQPRFLRWKKQIPLT